MRSQLLFRRIAHLLGSALTSEEIDKLRPMLGHREGRERLLSLALLVHIRLTAERIEDEYETRMPSRAPHSSSRMPQGAAEKQSAKSTKGSTKPKGSSPKRSYSPTDDEWFRMMKSRMDRER